VTDNEPTEPTEAAPAGETPTDEPKVFDEAYVKQLRDEAAAHRVKAKQVADELDKLRQQQMSDAEKAVAAAKAEGHAEAKKSFGKQLAAEQLKSAVKDKGLDLSEIEEFLTVDKFVDEHGDVDSKALKAAVDKFAKLAPKPGPSGGDAFGAPTQQPASLDAQIRAAESKGDWATARQLKTQKMFNH
jgi:hypothetical protein